MAAGKFTTTPSPIEVVEKVNAVIDDVAGKLSTSGTAAKATADASGNNIANTYATKAQAVTNLTASGKTVTFTKADGSTGTFTTQDTNTTYSAATTSAAGLMSAADKTKLNGIATGANAYSLPTASSSTLGGIKVGSGLSISNGVLSSSGGSAAVSAYKIPYATCSTATSTAAKVATITNGVSFSLVAGACCYVMFTNAIAGKNSKLNWTLNINSTGAKAAAWYHGLAGVDAVMSNAHGEYTYIIVRNPLFVYNGTYYLPIGEFDYAYYNDYADYS